MNKKVTREVKDKKKKKKVIIIIIIIKIMGMKVEKNKTYF